MQAVVGVGGTGVTEHAANVVAADGFALGLQKTLHQHPVGGAQFYGLAIGRRQYAALAVQLPGRGRFGRGHDAAMHGAYGQLHLLKGHRLGQIHVGTGVDDFGKDLGPQSP